MYCTVGTYVREKDKNVRIEEVQALCFTGEVLNF